MRGFIKNDFWIGAILIAEAVILLLFVKGWFSDRIPFFSREFEIILALIIVFFGLYQIQIHLKKSGSGSAGHAEAHVEVHGDAHADAGHGDAHAAHDDHGDAAADAHGGGHDDHGHH